MLIIGIVVIFALLVVIGIVLKISSQVNERLREVNISLQEAKSSIGQGLGNATNIFGDVKESLGRLEETNKQIYEKAKDVADLQELLRAPKFRGEIGETFLENLLSQVLPKDHIIIQYRFKTQDTVDAVIKLGSRLVPIDAKFPLENFKRLRETDSDDERNIYRKKFIQDVKSRIDEIGKKYILPDENTYDFAMMYIPAENVYYEMIIKEDLLSYAVSRKVIPTSPNTIYAYLQVICLGLKGLKIEENAMQILKNLSALSIDINKFRDDFGILGTHLRSASGKYEDANRRIERFSDKLLNIQNTSKLERKDARK